MNKVSYHLLNVFGVYKKTLKKNFYDNDRPAEYNDVRELLERRGQMYTVAELRRLFGFLWTAHDDCVDNNPDGFTALQVYHARQKIKFGQAVLEKLDRVEKEG